MDPVALIGLALFAAPPAGYPFAAESNRRATEVTAYRGVYRPRPGEAELPKAEAIEASAAAELTELLQRCAEGDRMAFRRLYELQSPRLYGIALRITRQASLAADAVHDALLQVWQNAGRFDTSRGNPEAWLVSLVRYRALDIARRSVREVPGLELPDTEDEEPDPLSRLIGTTEGEALQRCLQALEPDRRRLIVMAFTDGLTHSELATKLNQPLGTVKSWIRRTLLSLKRCLES
jgi:RNA polymerase sigma-70 factor (ECF subfamily)